MSLPYYKKYTKDFLEGTAGMPGELKGAYCVLLDLIYIQNGTCPDDPYYVSGNLGYSVRKWNAIKKELINLGKIEVKNGIISNKRADKEVLILSKYQDNQAKNRTKSNKNKDLPITTVDTVYNTEPDTDNNKKNIEKKSPRKSSIPEAWEPDQGCIDKAYSVGMDRSIIEVEAENFRNHHFNKQSKMVSWSLAWGTWCNNWKKFQANKTSPFPSKNKRSEFDALDELANKIEQGRGVFQ